MKIYTTRMTDDLRSMETLIDVGITLRRALWISITLHETKDSNYRITIQENISWVDPAAITITEEKFIGLLAILPIADYETLINYVEGK